MEIALNFLILKHYLSKYSHFSLRRGELEGLGAILLLLMGKAWRITIRVESSRNQHNPMRRRLESMKNHHNPI